MILQARYDLLKKYFGFHVDTEEHPKELYWIPYSEAKKITLNSLGDGFVRPGVNGNFHHKKDYHDFDRKICRAKNATGCKFPGNWVQDNNYCHIVTGRGVQKVYDDFDVLYNPRGSLISEGISTLVSSSDKCMKLELRP